MQLSVKSKPVAEIIHSIDQRIGYRTLETSHSDPSFHSDLRAQAILEEIHARLNQDYTYSSGKILGAMSTMPHEFAKLVYTTYLDRNLGDRGLNPGAADIEAELISILGNLLGDGSVRGNIVAGGTEANLIAMYLAKQIKKKIDHPEIVLPESAHYSFTKAALLMGLQLRKARLLPNFTVDMDHYSSLITDNTIALVGVVGTTSLGLIDPILQIASLAKKHHLYLHIDGAFGGLVVPFLEAIGGSFPPYRLSIPEICSFTVDPHKMGMGVNPTGGILLKKSFLEQFQFEIPYLAGGCHPSFNILGTHPGASAISFWALMQYLGYEGFMNVVRSVWENTLYLKERLERFSSIQLATEPVMNILGIQLKPEKKWSIEKLDAKLRSRGWALGLFSNWQLLRVVIMPHVLKSHIDAFITDLHEILGE